MPSVCYAIKRRAPPDVLFLKAWSIGYPISYCKWYLRRYSRGYSMRFSWGIVAKHILHRRSSVRMVSIRHFMFYRVSHKVLYKRYFAAYKGILQRIFRKVFYSVFYLEILRCIERVFYKAVVGNLFLVCWFLHRISLPKSCNSTGNFQILGSG